MLNELFEELITNINPDAKAIKKAKKSQEKLRDNLSRDTEYSKIYVDSFLYGSYKRHTAIGTIKDVDIVIITNYETNASPKDVLAQLKRTLGKYYKTTDLNYQRRSIRVENPLGDNSTDLTLDVIPAIKPSENSDVLLVPDKELNKWIESNPKGHIRYIENLNKVTSALDTIKMFKHFWNYHSRKIYPKDKAKHEIQPKGFWIECLVAENIPQEFLELSDSFTITLENILNKYNSPAEIPEIMDPGLENKSISTSMELEEYEKYYTKLNEILKLVKNTGGLEDNKRISEIWNQIFGDEFPISSTEGVTNSVSTETFVLGNVAHAQQPPWTMNLQYTVGLQASLYSIVGTRRTKFRGISSDSSTLAPNLYIRFVSTHPRIPGEFDVKWQVVNTGNHAKNKNGLRGGFFEAKGPTNLLSSDPCINWERTEYTGKHWVQCFIIQNNVCIGRSAKFFVNIKNSEFIVL